MVVGFGIRETHSRGLLQTDWSSKQGVYVSIFWCTFFWIESEISQFKLLIHCIIDARV